MDILYILMAGLTAIVLFVFGLENFSAEVQKISGEGFRRFLAKATRIPVVGVLIGALVTAVIQSSSATSVITASLVNGGVLSFENSVGIIFGANIGTTITAQLVAFKLTAFAPAIIILGFALSLVPSRVSIFGKSIFYFGFVFFSLNLISGALEPLKDEPVLRDYLLEPQGIMVGIVVGCLFTALVQSSSVTTGLTIVFAQQGLLGVENAIPIVIGANIGTTVTALIAMMNMDFTAKKTALSHVLFNVGGVLLALPFLFAFSGMISSLDVDPAILLANVHLVFNVVTSLFFLALIKPFTRLINLLLGEEKAEFQKLTIPRYDENTDYQQVRLDLRKNRNDLFDFMRESYSLVSLSIESDYKSISDTATKRMEYTGYLEREYVQYFSTAVTSVTNEDESRDLLRLNTQFDYLFQIYDSVDDIFNTKIALDKSYVELRGDLLLMVRGVSNQTLGLFDEIHESLLDERRRHAVTRARESQQYLDQVNRQLLVLLAEPDRRDAGILSNFVTYSRRLQDKLVNFAAHLEEDLTSTEGAGRVR